eukprot:scaffold7363_cov263-Pinguiococcus_pyrenoidosus.AAC.3
MLRCDVSRVLRTWKRGENKIERFCIIVVGLGDQKQLRNARRKAHAFVQVSGLDRRPCVYASVRSEPERERARTTCDACGAASPGMPARMHVAQVRDWLANALAIHGPVNGVRPRIARNAEVRERPPRVTPGRRTTEERVPAHNDSSWGQEKIGASWRFDVNVACQQRGRLMVHATSAGFELRCETLWS